MRDAMATRAAFDIQTVLASSLRGINTRQRGRVATKAICVRVAFDRIIFSSGCFHSFVRSLMAGSLDYNAASCYSVQGAVGVKIKSITFLIITLESTQRVSNISGYLRAIDIAAQLRKCNSVVTFFFCYQRQMLMMAS